MGAGAMWWLKLDAVREFRTSSSALSKTYYEVLEVSKNASDGDIKKAFYKLAKKYHPDTNQGDPTAAEKFQEVQRAYDTLRDPQKRAAYDQLGHSAYESAEAGGGSPGAGPFSGGQQVDPEELFREFFGRGGGQSAHGFHGTIFEHIFGGTQGFGARPRRGRSIQAGMTITFDEAVKGTTRRVDLSALGIRGLPHDSVEVNIPAGVDDGFQLQVEGKGMPGPQGMPPGDLLLQIMVLPSPNFKREGFDLYTEAKLDMIDAVLGTKIDVKSIHGSVEVRIKPGTQSGDKLRMRGYGVPMDLMGQRGRKGDQFVVIKVNIPKKISEYQRKLLEEFKAADDPKHIPSFVETASVQTQAQEDSKHETGMSKEDTTKDTKKKKRGWFNFNS